MPQFLFEVKGEWRRCGWGGGSEEESELGMAEEGLPNLDLSIEIGGGE